jgi:hypothetical protein
MSWPRGIRPAEDGILRSPVVRLTSQLLVLSVMIGSGVLAGNALRAEKATPPIGTDIAVGPTAEPPSEDPEPDEPQTEDPEPRESRPTLPTPEEQHSRRSGFRHPGVFVTLPQLEFMREQVRAR